MNYDEAVKYIQTAASERIKQIKQMLGSFKIFLGKIVPNGLRNGKWAYKRRRLYRIVFFRLCT